MNDAARISTLDSRTRDTVIRACRLGYQQAWLHVYDEAQAHVHNIKTAYYLDSLGAVAGALFALSTEVGDVVGSWNGYAALRDAAHHVAALALKGTIMDQLNTVDTATLKAGDQITDGVRNGGKYRTFTVTSVKAFTINATGSRGGEHLFVRNKHSGQWFSITATRTGCVTLSKV